MRKYRALTGLLSPLMPLWLQCRKARGKEDGARLRERYGYASAPRPPGRLLWLHAASVGEANSVLLLIGHIRARFPHIVILLTTGTVTSAQLMRARLPAGVIHQYAPIDTPDATLRFMRHWRPQLAFWVESEFWPNLIMTADRFQCYMGVINARMSERSFTRWQKRPAMINELLGCFDIVFAQSEADGARLKALGAKEVVSAGNLKYDAALLPCDEAELVRLQQEIGKRPLWLAASTHPGEEAMVAQAHGLLAVTRGSLLTVIVPRHPERGGEIARVLKGKWRVAQRSLGEPVRADTQIYIADTLGELGLFYRLCEIVFMGGSLVRHGGQNPLEPARLACAIVTGPHTHNFDAMYRDMEQAGLLLRVSSPETLAAQLGILLGDVAARSAMQNNVRQWVEGKSGAAARLLEWLSPLLEPGGKGA